MAALKSRKALFNALKAKGFFPLNSIYRRPQDLPNEVYGRKAVCYPGFLNVGQRHTAEDFLEQEGFRVNREFSPLSPTAAVQVSYFKGLHWDE